VLKHIEKRSQGLIFEGALAGAVSYMTWLAPRWALVS